MSVPVAVLDGAILALGFLVYCIHGFSQEQRRKRNAVGRIRLSTSKER